MNDSNFTIKIHDFLSKKTLSDVVVFSNKFSTSLPQVPEWISCNVLIQAWDEKSFFITVQDLQYTIQTSCDVCEDKVTREKKPNDIFLKFFADCDEELLKENEYSFTWWEWYVDIEQILIQEIVLDQDISHMCKACSKDLESKNDEIVHENSIIWK